MGIVWEASNLRTHRTVALKILKAETADQRRRLLREGRIAGKLQHPNIVEVYDVVELADGAPAIVMERLRGESLRALLARETRLSLSRVVEIFTPIARALECAHAQGVVHRDLKPDNVFLARDSDEREQVKVLDFGIARLTAAEGDTAATSSFTETGDVLGTPSYMAPEQVFGENDVDTRADVWSFGVLLYECLAGQKPFIGDNFGQIFKNVAMGLITPIGELAPDVPPELAALIMRMLTRDRTLRPDDWAVITAVIERGLAPAHPQQVARGSRILLWCLAAAVALTGGGLMARRVGGGGSSRAAHADAAPTNDVLALTSAPSLPALPSSSAAALPSATLSPPRPPPPPSARPLGTPLPGGVHGTSPY